MRPHPVRLLLLGLSLVLSWPSLSRAADWLEFPLRWFTQVSSGIGSTGGTLTLDRYYPTAFSLNLDLGYDCNRWCSFIPLSLSYREHRFDREPFEALISARVNRLAVVPDVVASDWPPGISPPSGISNLRSGSKFWSASLVPSVVFRLPLTRALSLSALVGVGLWRNSAQLDTDYDYDVLFHPIGYGVWNNQGTVHSRVRERYLNAGLRLGGGEEYRLNERMTLSLGVRWEAINTPANQSFLRVEGWELVGGGLLTPTPKEEHWTRLLELTGGLRYYY